MNKIKFSTNYPKLWNQRKAKLVHLQKVDGKNISSQLLEYDTKTIQGSYYPLPKKDLIQLIFIGDYGIPFCTLRIWTEEKFRYYAKAIGDMFEIVIMNE